MAVRKTGNNKKWYVDFSFNHIRYRKPSPANTRAGALAYESVLRHKLARGESLEPTAVKEEPKIHFQEFVKDWFETYVKNNNKHSEIVTKGHLLRAHLIPYFGSMELSAISNLDVEKFKRLKLSQGLAAKSINNHLTILRKALHCAQEWGHIERLPLIKPLKTAPAKYDFLTKEESRLLLTAAEGEWHDMILLALETGLRFGELIALRWEDVDFTTGEFTISRSYAKGVLGSTKSNRIRHIPISDNARNMLLLRPKRHDLVFAERDGEPLSHKRCIRELHIRCQQAGLRPIGWHTFRHTFASGLVQDGANLLAVKELLGHSDIHTTMRYAHLNRSALHQAMQLRAGDSQI